jgi:hypothetical protein
MKAVPGFDERYLIPRHGRFIYDTKKRTCIYPHMSGVSRRNYPQITLYHEGLKFTKRVHSWMAITYLGMIYDGTRKLVVDHKNNNQYINHIRNLRIVTMAENNRNR